MENFIDNLSKGELKEFRKIQVTIIRSIFKDAVAHREIDVNGKSEQEIQEEFDKYLKKYVKNRKLKNAEVRFVIDYRDSILAEARKYLKNEKFDLASVLYATWIEHWMNSTIRYLVTIKGLTEKDTIDIIRTSNFRSKISWVLKLLDGKPIFNPHRVTIMELLEKRNAFVHYKFKGIDPDNNEGEKQLQLVLKKIEKTISYLKYYEKKYIFQDVPAKMVV